MGDEAYSREGSDACLFCVFKKDKGNRQSQRPSFLTRVLGGDGGSNKVLRGSKKTGACDD